MPLKSGTKDECRLGVHADLVGSIAGDGAEDRLSGTLSLLEHGVESGAVWIGGHGEGVYEY